MSDTMGAMTEPSVARVHWALVVLRYIIEVDGRPVGFAQSWHADELSGGVDLFLEPSARGFGYVRDVAHALATHLMTAEGWRRVTADPDVANLAGMRMWTSAGFVSEGPLPEAGECILVFGYQARSCR